MKNKLGVSEDIFYDIERKVVSLKLKLLDERFTFNKDELNFEYLTELNKFLFDDLYLNDEIGIIDNFENINEVKEKLNLINDICISNCRNSEEISNLITDIWSLQPFKVGNTRTLLAFLKMINSVYSLNFEIDLDEEIISSPRMFEFKHKVNQKRLTKNK